MTARLETRRLCVIFNLSLPVGEDWTGVGEEKSEIVKGPLEMLMPQIDPQKINTEMEIDHKFPDNSRRGRSQRKIAVAVRYVT